MTELAVDLADVHTARERIADDVVHTRSSRSRTLSAITGAEVVVKFENLQFTGSFKDRGAANRIRLLTEEEASRGVITVSAGNHAQGVAHHAHRLGVPATIVMPTSAPFSKVVGTETLGATVHLEGATFAEASEVATRLQEEHGLTFIHPYDDPAVIAGQGTVGLELSADHDDLDVVVVPVGGGGLISGTAVALRGAERPIEIIGVQSETYPGMIAALQGETLTVSTTDTIADGIAVKQPGRLTVPIVEALVDDVVTVPEELIEAAVARFIEIEKTVAEGAGAAALAAVLADPGRFAGRRVGVILSGGNIDTRILSSLLMRELTHDHRLVQVRVHIDDLPGQLASVSRVIGEAGANILEVEHRRLFGHVSARTTDLDFLLETRDADHAELVRRSLAEAGFEVELAGPD